MHTNVEDSSRTQAGEKRIALLHDCLSRLKKEATAFCVEEVRGMASVTSMTVQY